MLHFVSKFYRKLGRALSGAKIIIEMESGGVALLKGKILTRYLREIQEVLAKQQVTCGQIRGFEGGGFTRWAFSAEIPPHVHQTLRNILGEAA